MANVKLGPTVVDDVARAALDEILADSIERKSEYGGMIYVLSGKCSAAPARTQGDPNKVDVGQHEPNCGCPKGSSPVAFYHTHPIVTFAGFHAVYNEFSPEDRTVAEEHALDAYLGTVDGSFFKFDRKQGKPIRLAGSLKNTKGRQPIPKRW